MNDFLDIYTRLKMETDSDIILTYYSSYGHKETKKFKLIDAVGFSYILVENEEGKVSIPFFGMDAMIESITIRSSNKPIYFNPYVNKDIFDGFYIKKGYPENIKQCLLGEITLNLEDRENFIQKYKAKESTFEYDELFFSERQKREFTDFFELLIKDLSNYCKKNGLDSNLKLIGKGTTSIIYSIGDKIVKIGKPRRKSSIPYCEYILQPVINRDFEFDGYPIHIEVTQKVFVCESIKDSWSNEKFVAIRDELAEKLQAIGLKSTDLHPSNIGILMSENRIHFDSINFDVGNEVSTSIQNNNNLKIKGPGEFVIIDLDCLEIEDIDKYSNYLKNIGFSLKNSDTTKKR
jgi:hypothetical protein